MPAAEPLKAFVSYKWGDDAHNRWVEAFATDLRTAGIDAILDKWEVQLGESFTEYMASRIDEADVVLFIITTGSVAAVEAPQGKGGAVKFEMQMAMARKIAGNLRVIGIYREGNKPPAHLRDHRYADFRKDEDYDKQLITLVNDLFGRSTKPPLGGKKLAPEEAKIAELQQRYEDAVSHWYDANYNHMAVDSEQDMSIEIAGWRRRFEDIEKEMKALGAEPRNKPL